MTTAKHGIQDFADARYNVLSIGEKRITQAFPELERFPEFKFNYRKTLNLSNQNIIKYVMLMYMDNILRKSVPDLIKRKREAALLAGFTISDVTKRFPDKLEKIFRCEVPEVNALIVRVVRLNNDSAFEQLAVYDEARARQMVKLLSPATGDEKTKEIHENIRRMTADITELEQEILMREKSKDLINSMYYEIENIQLGIRPEEIAEAKRAGAIDQILYDPTMQKLPEMPNIDLRKVRRGRPKKDA